MVVDKMSVVPTTKGIKVHFARELTAFDYEYDDPLNPTNESPEPSDYHKKQVNVYCSVCSKLKIVPVSFIQRRLCDPKISIRGRGLGNKGIKAVSVTLVKNHTVEYLDVSDNDISNEGVKAIAQMLEENTSIANLNLAENKIGHEGIEVLCESVAHQETLKVLDLSSVGCQNKQIISVKNMLDQNLHLTELRLAHNEISDEGCMLLRKAISDNDTLEILDLSWNHIRGQGAKAIAAGLMDNRGLKSINLSWNGFALEGSKALCQALMKNKTLLELNVSHNRIHSVALAAILFGMKKNITLSALGLKGNPLTPMAAVKLLETIGELKQCNLRELDLSDIVVNETFLDILTELQTQNPLLKIKHGPLLTYSHTEKDIKDENGISSTDPRQLLLNLIERDGLRIIDLFQQMDTDKSLALSKEEFQQGLLNANVTVTEAQIDDLLKLMDADKNNVIDLGEMINTQREHEIEKLPEGET